jgi:chemotaxis signal transduction protein
MQTPSLGTARNASVRSALLLSMGGARYALAVSHVIEVLPLAALQPCPGAPAYVAGMVDYRGTPLVTYDLCLLHAGRRAALRLTTRILIVRGAEGQAPPGLIAEHVDRTIPLPAAAATSAATLVEAGVIVHVLQPDDLLPPYRRWSPLAAEAGRGR